MKYFPHVIITIVLAALVTGIAIVGSPQNQRKQRFDDQRVNDLQNIQWQVLNYWQQKSRLPGTLDDLTDNFSGYRAPVDPETKAAYEYQATGETAFKLCATFTNESSRSSLAPYPAVPASKGLSEIWDHGAGQICFDRVIDKEVYKPINP